MSAAVHPRRVGFPEDPHHRLMARPARPPAHSSPAVAASVRWLIPSGTFGEMVTEPNSKGRFRFSASMKPDSKDRWSPFRLTAAELPRRILVRLVELEKAGVE
ncbi:hypothetical protein ABZX69_37665 [Streptomyces sp. NPDC004074]|uniref:hypothetical protein n=1 Tax=Streptomyces sp. NPDC004074 TaxID=3154277 RepID=UPI00339F7997